MPRFSVYACCYWQFLLQLLLNASWRCWLFNPLLNTGFGLLDVIETGSLLFLVPTLRFTFTKCRCLILFSCSLGILRLVISIVVPSSQITFSTPIFLISRRQYIVSSSTIYSGRIGDSEDEEVGSQSGRGSCDWQVSSPVSPVLYRGHWVGQIEHFWIRFWVFQVD